MFKTLRNIVKRYSGVEPRIMAKLPESKPNLIMLTYDSCRYDSLVRAKTPVLDQYTQVYRAYSPATYTYPAHQSFFCGMLPGVLDPLPYYNRFIKQLIALKDAGDSIVERESGNNTFVMTGVENFVLGLSRAGYYTVGSAGANWFAKKSLRVGFKDFYFTNHAKAINQIELILHSIRDKARDKNFFAFINFMETHTPYMHYNESEYHMTARKKMSWPPCYNPQDAAYGEKLHQAQIQAVEYLDTCLPHLLHVLPKNTIVILLGDHGEAFGEDGYWGHGVYHEKVIEVPLSIFTL